MTNKRWDLVFGDQNAQNARGQTEGTISLFDLATKRRTKDVEYDRTCCAFGIGTAI